MRIEKIVIVLVCLVHSAATWAVTYSPYRPDGSRGSFVPPTETYKSGCGLAAEAPQMVFRSTSVVPVTISNVKALNADGSVSMAYTTEGQNNVPRHIRKGLDLDEEDEPTGGLVPVGDIPWLLIALLVAVREWMTGRCSRRFLGWTGVRKS